MPSHTYSWGLVPELLVALLLISLFVIITVSDLNYMIIPDKVLIVFSVIFIAVRLIIPIDPWWVSLVGGAVGFALLLLIAVISRGGMGGGDIKLFALIGFVLGLKGLLLSFFLSTLFGALFGGLGLVLGLLKRKQAIPFGPFIAIGTLTTYFYGETIVQIYLSFLQSGF
ncbi:prepilin peptidase [Mesobacillus subterraneus]|uniref:prepilin peptidase n=1 Tax=Mesobacillus subterraneus TaxID=285983 RepID=UPI003531A2EC